MIKLFFFAFISVVIPINAQVQLAWFNYPGGVSIATDVSNNVYTANWDYNSGGDITLTKRDAAGNILWEVPYNNTDATRHEVATWVETDGAGNVLVSGTIRSGYSNPVNAASLLMKFSPSGTLLWRVVYESSFEGSSTRKCLVDADNNIYVLGIGTGPNGQVTKVKKFNSSGVAVWNYFDSGIGGPITFKFTPDKNIVIVHRGITGSINGYSKIDLNGNNIWSKGGYQSLAVGDAAGDTFGNTYITNSSNPGSILTKLSPAGAVIWSQTNTIIGNKVEVGSDNNPVIGGYPSAGYGVVILKYDSNGNLLWQNLDADGSNLALLALAPMKLDAFNAAYIAGSTMSQMGVCKVNSDGTSAWAATTSSGYPVWFEFGTDNSVFVMGGTTARFIQTGSIPAPAAPTSLSAIASSASAINLAWTDKATNETSYVIQRSLTASSGFTTIATVAANATSYSNSGLTSSTTYYYRIQAANAGGSSAWSNIANAATAAGPPAVPANLSATAAGSSTINLAWTDNATNETSFTLQRSLSAGSGYVTIATLSANTKSYSNSGLTSSTTYYYRIQAANSTGSSEWSNVTYSKTATSGPPPAPSNLYASAKDCNTIILTWIDNSTNEASFELRRSMSLSGTYSTIATLPANTTTYTNTGLTKGRRYYYKVRAANTPGNSAWSNIANATASCSTASKSGEVAETLKLYPNPATYGLIFLDLPDDTLFPSILEIYSLTGLKVLHKELYDSSNTIDISKLNNGFYIISLNSNGIVHKLKLQINK